MRSRAQTLWEPTVPTDIPAADILDVLPGFVWRLDREFRFTSVSDKVFEINGLEVGHVIGARFEDLDLVWEGGCDPLTRREAFHDREALGPARHGRRARLKITGRPFFEASEGFVGYVGSVVDLGTSNPAVVFDQEAAATTRGHLDVFRNAVECLTDGLALFDPDDRLIFCNSSFRRMNENARWHLDGQTTFEMIVRSNMELGLL